MLRVGRKDTLASLPVGIACKCKDNLLCCRLSQREQGVSDKTGVDPLDKNVTLSERAWQCAEMKGKKL
jgi:hypothetical protein